MDDVYVVLVDDKFINTILKNDRVVHLAIVVILLIVNVIFLYNLINLIIKQSLGLKMPLLLLQLLLVIDCERLVTLLLDHLLLLEHVEGGGALQAHVAALATEPLQLFVGLPRCLRSARSGYFDRILFANFFKFYLFVCSFQWVPYPSDV